MGASIGLPLLALFGCGGEQTQERAPVARPVKTVVVGGTGETERSYPGTTQAADRVELSFRVGGPLIEFPVDEGQHVKKGQLLARIDPRDYQIALDKARAEFEKAEADLARYKRLYEQDAVPISDLELRQAQRDVARAHADDAEASLGDTYLRAPFDGEIGEKYVENREDVRPKEAVMSLQGLGVVEIVINVPESGRAQFSDEALREISIVATFDFAPGREFELTPTEFASQADPRTRTYKATLSMAQPEGISVRPGMTATVRVTFTGSAAAETNEFVVPAHAVFAGDDGTQYVWVVNEGELTVQQREVAVGEVTGSSSIRIVDGRAAGERIATTGVTQLREGMKIRLMD
jgi:RND family efflux transporter MFP subunit